MGISAFRNAEDLAAEIRTEELQKAQSELSGMPEARYEALGEAAKHDKPKKRKESANDI